MMMTPNRREHNTSEASLDSLKVVYFRMNQQIVKELSEACM